MPHTLDVAVVGTGSTGSAAAYFLARRGLKVAAFEQFTVVNTRAGHSGHTRIIRHPYAESEAYVPLVLRADELWVDIEEESGNPLLVRTGGLDLAPPGYDVAARAAQSCRTHGLPYEYLDSGEIADRWPQWRLSEGWQGCYSPNSGFLLVENCIRSMAEGATRAGADIRENEPVTAVKDRGDHVEITTAHGRYLADHVVVTAGAWTKRILDELDVDLVVKRKVQLWLETNDLERFAPERFPVFVSESDYGTIYGLPIYDTVGVKMARHDGGEAIDPDFLDRTPHREDQLNVPDFALSHMSGITGRVVDARVCMYTCTPDGDFIIDRHPTSPRLVIGAGFSGHGFKFASAVGEVLADLVTRGETEQPIHHLRLSRFI